MKSQTCNVLAASRIWTPGIEERLSQRTGTPFVLISEKERLNVAELTKLGPQRVFLPHWSFKIPEELHTAFECVIFHMTDVPFGRGGSPLQNLIARGIYDTKITALRCAVEMDAGPVYLKRPFSLANGTAQQLLTAATHLNEDMIVEIVKTNSVPQPQRGTPVVFKRRGPADSDLTAASSIQQAYDFIRMLEADGYSPAFLEVGELRYEFSAAVLDGTEVRAQVTITRRRESRE